MLVVPDPTTAFLDPFAPATTLVLTCNIRDPMTGQSYSRDPRYIAQKAETYLKGTGRADTSYFGPEAEFFVFNDVRYGQGINYAFHEIDSSEAVGTPVRRKRRIWATGRARKRDTFRFPDRQHAGSPHRNGADDGVAGGSDRSPSP
jgi:glutamine synthetase